jgi:uncharacterized membrane protein SirB2
MDNIELFNLMKSIHMLTLLISIIGFILRGIWMMKDSPLLKSKLVRVLPHVNDTFLLISAVWAGALIGQYPFVNGWLTAKILGAIAYIVFGALALSYGRTKAARIRFFVLALLCLGYVITVAATKNPLPF